MNEGSIMQLGWKGPFRFYSCQKSCPECHSRLVTQTTLDSKFFRGLYHDLGVACHCVTCNIRYRAFGIISFKKVFITVSFWILLGMGLILFLTFWLFHSWIIRAFVFALLFLLLWRLPRFLFSVTERLWWEKARLEKIFAYEVD